jgi:hypothetical protein
MIISGYTGASPACVAHAGSGKSHEIDEDEGKTMTQTIPPPPADDDLTRVIERPDGFYWQEKETNREYGPFVTLLEAVQDMQSSAETTFEPGEALKEAEAEIGISDWVDSDTNEPAEEERPRIEDDH